MKANIEFRLCRPSFYQEDLQLVMHVSARLLYSTTRDKLEETVEEFFKERPRLVPLSIKAKRISRLEGETLVLPVKIISCKTFQANEYREKLRLFFEIE